MQFNDGMHVQNISPSINDLEYISPSISGVPDLPQAYEPSRKFLIRALSLLRIVCMVVASTWNDLAKNMLDYTEI